MPGSPVSGTRAAGCVVEGLRQGVEHPVPRPGEAAGRVVDRAGRAEADAGEGASVVPLDTTHVNPSGAGGSSSMLARSAWGGTGAQGITGNARMQAGQTQ